MRAAENSEVLLPGSVAVAVIVWPTETAVAGEKVNEALPVEASVVTLFSPMNFLPSSPEGLE